MKEFHTNDEITTIWNKAKITEKKQIKAFINANNKPDSKLDKYFYLCSYEIFHKRGGEYTHATKVITAGMRCELPGRPGHEILEFIDNIPVPEDPDGVPF